ncbi:putative membrane protein [Candidatus Rubidus massiliensis]|nr:putative membrane protein [Candidatus Rubidus massiliensis]
MKYFIVLFFVLSFTFLFGHEEHKGMKETVQESVHPTQGEQPTVKQFGGRPQSWAQWIGGFHFILLHFPLALIAMTGFSELLFAYYHRPIFDYASRFMLIAAAILAVPTALLGLIYSYTATYSGLLADFVFWHMWAGITTAILAIIVALIRERYGITKLYYTCLVILFLLVNITGFLGGGMTFGPYHMLPPL